MKFFCRGFVLSILFLAASAQVFSQTALQKCNDVAFAYKTYFLNADDEKVQNLYSYCEKLSACLQEDSQETFNFCVAESLFFMSEILDSEDYKNLAKNSPGITAAAERDCVNCLKKYFSSKTGADIYSCSKISPEKKAEIENKIEFDSGALVSSPYSFSFSILPQSSDTSRKILFYKGMSDTSAFFSNYDPRLIKKMFENPFVIFMLEKTDIDFETTSRAYGDFENFVNEYSVSERIIPASKCKFFSVQMNEKVLSRIDENSASFYYFWIYSHWLDSLSAQFGIDLTLFFNNEFLSELDSLLENDTAFLEIFTDLSNVNEVLPKMKSICESVSWIAPRYYALEYGVFPDD